MAISFSGIGSGIDTASLVTSLMGAERMAGNGLTTNKNAAQSLANVLTSLNGQMKSLGDAAKALTPDRLSGGGSVFSTVTPKSTNDAIATATATDKATAGSLSFTVKSIAQAGSGTFGTSFAADAKVGTDDFSFTIGAGDKSAAINVKAGSSLQDVAALINQSDSGVKATTVQVAPNTYKLQVTSATTGESSNINIVGDTGTPTATSLLGEFKELTRGQDTVLTVGSGVNAYDVHSPTRDVKDMIPGVTISPVKADPTASVTIDLAADVDGMAAKMEAFVKAANAVTSAIDSNSKWDAEKKTGGPLVGDSMTRVLKTDLQNVFTGSSTFSTKTAGITIERDGSFTFDKAAFKAAYASDPEGTVTGLTDIATKMGEVSKQATSAADGTLTQRITAEQSAVKGYTAQLAKFEERMTLRESTLKQQFAAMDSLLAKMQTQGSWMSSQIASLPTY